MTEPIFMVSDLFKSISEMWQYNPSFIILLLASVIIFILSVINTHRYRNQIQNYRHRSNYH